MQICQIVLTVKKNSVFQECLMSLDICLKCHDMSMFKTCLYFSQAMSHDTVAASKQKALGEWTVSVM